MGKNVKYNVAVDPDVWADVGKFAESAGLKTPNTLLAAVAVELQKAYKKKLNLWHVLGRIAADDIEDGRAQIVEREPRRTLATRS